MYNVYSDFVFDPYNAEWLWLADNGEISINLLPDGNILIADCYYMQYGIFTIDEVIHSLENEPFIQYGNFKPVLHLSWHWHHFKNLKITLIRAKRFMARNRAIE